MSQSRFSIVLVGVSALLRRPLVSRLRPAGFTARGSGGFRRSGRPSVSALPLGELTFGLTASAFRHAPLRSCPRRVGASAFRFGDCRSASWPSDSRLPLFGTHRFGVTARRVGLRAHGFRFSVRTASGLPSASWSSGSLLPLFGTHRFGDCRWVGWFCRLPLRGCHSAGWFFCLPFRRLPLSGVAFGLTASAFRHAPIRTAAPPTRGPTEHTDTTLVSLQNTYPNMLTYHIVRRKHFKTGKLLYYPQLVTPVADDHMHIIERIEKKCTLASADVKAVVDALEVEIIDSLRQGRSVRLGDLGSFRPTLRCSAGVDLSELAGVGQIKRVHVVFHPSSRIRRALSVKDHAVSFVQRDKKKHGANAQQGGSPTGGATPGAPAPSTGSSAAGSAVTPPGTPVPAPPSTGTPAPSTGSSAAGSTVPAAPSPTTSTTTGTPAPSTGSSAAGSAVTPPGTPVPAPPSTGTPAGTPVPAAPSPTTSTTTGTPAPSTGTPAAGGA